MRTCKRKLELASHEVLMQSNNDHFECHHSCTFREHSILFVCSRHLILDSRRFFSSFLLLKRNLAFSAISISNSEVCCQQQARKWKHDNGNIQLACNKTISEIKMSALSVNKVLLLPRTKSCTSDSVRAFIIACYGVMGRARQSNFQK